jgi:uncharacterized SAM-binding protein YcdF (DUF218 family)
MATTFRHPGTGRCETVGTRSSLLALFGNIAYLAYQGLWTHVFMAGVILVIPLLLCCGWMAAFTLPLLSLAYAFCIQDLLAARYLDQGWVEQPPAGR